MDVFQERNVIWYNHFRLVFYFRRCLCVVISSIDIISRVSFADRTTNNRRRQFRKCHMNRIITILLIVIIHFRRKIERVSNKIKVKTKHFLIRAFIQLSFLLWLKNSLSHIDCQFIKNRCYSNILFMHSGVWSLLTKSNTVLEKQHCSFTF